MTSLDLSACPPLRDYWRRHQADLPAAAALPSDHRSDDPRPRTAALPAVPMPIALTGGDAFLGYVCVVTATALALARLSGRTKSTIAVPPLHSTSGASLPVPVDTSPVRQVHALLNEVRECLLQVHAREAYPVEDTSAAVVVMEGLHSLDRRPSSEVGVRFGAPGDFVRGVVSLPGSSYRSDTAKRLAAYVAAILTGLSRPAGLGSVGDLVRAAESTLGERRAALRGPRTELPGSSLSSLFAAQVDATPDATALLTVEGSTSYRELAEAAAEVAELLLAAGVRPGDLVGLRVDRSPRALAGLLGVLRVGAAYLPLSPEQPFQRSAAVAREAGAVLVLGVRDGGWADVSARFGLSAAPSATVSEKDDPVVCVLHTSGSAGTPHAVPIGRRAVLNRLRWMWREHPFDSGEVLAWVKPIGLVGSLWECLGALLRGVPTAIVTSGELADPEALCARFVRDGVTRLCGAPALVELILDEVGDDRGRLGALRWVSSSAEPLPPALAARWVRSLPDVALVNLYGLTECASNVAVQDIREVPASMVRLSIGRPIDNCELHVLDAEHRPVPIGAVGQLHVAGACVADGYQGRPDLTAERFTVTPSGARRFATGDLARVVDGDRVELLGRADNQVKLRGFRIGLEEVEAVLGRAAGVVDAAAAVIGEGRDARLVGYLTGTADLGELRGHCSAVLPAQMVPSEFVRLESLPRTSAGKLARARLPELAPRKVGFVLPDGVTAAQSQVLAEVARLLGHAVRLSDRLDELDLHSLRMVRLHRRLRPHAPAGLVVAELFRCGTVAALAGLLEPEQRDGRAAAKARGRRGRTAISQLAARSAKARRAP
ncbi:non-ribosomal peptide synthetase [Amycolatopsis sp. H20-H5]|uniref:non-ribosomal peptide synthetase n=1 Tax=Amycolatopsis sp. H20-H5 TaxID=3046309 RepID=UPI002DBC1B6B|nr:amino acid adenylation domain-containing protein [Amycolatopsis sp. H20-H5]MEC3979005.1 amino acid adenylation domain-containing protein [Amycolatopsis sp. H20-H5]